jgi:hypothetical protein
MFYLAVDVLRVRAAPGSSLATYVLAFVFMYLWSLLYRTLKFFLQFRCVCLILSFNVLCYLHKVKAQCGGSDFISETKSLNLVLFDIGRLTLKKRVDWLV